MRFISYLVIKKNALGQALPQLGNIFRHVKYSLVYSRDLFTITHIGWAIGKITVKSGVCYINDLSKIIIKQIVDLVAYFLGKG